MNSASFFSIFLLLLLQHDDNENLSMNNKIVEQKKVCNYRFGILSMNFSSGDVLNILVDSVLAKLIN